MEIETSTTEVIADVNASPEKVVAEEAAEKEEQKASATEEVASDADKPKTEKRPIEAPKNNGTPITPVKKPVSGIVVQFPEMFSLKRDAHFLETLVDATDIKLQKIGYIECESEEAATELQAKLNASDVNGKKVTASRLDLTEKNILYCNGIRKEDTDEILKEAFPQIKQIKRESYNTFILFDNENESRAARTQIIKEGINGHKIICEFDNSGKNRFKAPEEPAAKKSKVLWRPEQEQPFPWHVLSEQVDGAAEVKEESTEKEGEATEAVADMEATEEAVKAEEEETKVEEEESADKWMSLRAVDQAITEIGGWGLEDCLGIKKNLLSWLFYCDFMIYRQIIKEKY